MEAFVDDTTIGPDVLLYRRITPQWIDWDNLDAQGRPRIKSAAFQDYPAQKALAMGYPGPCMSVGLEPVLREHGHEAVKMLDEHPGYGLAALIVGKLRETGEQGVMPRPEPAEPWHGVVFSTIGDKRTGAMKKLRQGVADWALVPNRTNASR